MKAQFPHFVFGYGSLICPDSRAITAPTVAERSAIPVTVQNVERTWAKQSKRGMTAMGVRFREGAECVGVLVPVNDDELSQFDAREIGYDRVELQAEQVLQVPFLEDDYYNNTFLGEDDIDPPQIWVYIQQEPIAATETHPIVQSYLDIILRGCLTISEEFADAFMESTVGFHPSEISDDSDNDDDDYDQSSSENDDDEDEENGMSSSDDSEHWIDDRHDPIYVRADVQYSKKHSKTLDRVLRKHRPNDFKKRIRKGKSQLLRVKNQ
jgi:hypothetical protein